jgi:hypothetical protein
MEGFGRSITQASAEGGDAILREKEKQEQMKEKQEQMDALTAYNGYEKTLINRTNNLKNYEGNNVNDVSLVTKNDKDKKDLFSYERDNLPDIRKGFVSNLSPRSALIFNELADETDVNHLKQVATYQAHESRQYKVEQLNNFAENAILDINNNPSKERAAYWIEKGNAFIAALHPGDVTEMQKRFSLKIEEHTKAILAQSRVNIAIGSIQRKFLTDPQYHGDKVEALVAMDAYLTDPDGRDKVEKEFNLSLSDMDNLRRETGAALVNEERMYKNYADKTLLDIYQKMYAPKEGEPRLMGQAAITEIMNSSLNHTDKMAAVTKVKQCENDTKRDLLLQKKLSKENYLLDKQIKQTQRDEMKGNLLKDIIDGNITNVREIYEKVGGDVETGGKLVKVFNDFQKDGSFYKKAELQKLHAWTNELAGGDKKKQADLWAEYSEQFTKATEGITDPDLIREAVKKLEASKAGENESWLKKALNKVFTPPGSTFGAIFDRTQESSVSPEKEADYDMGGYIKKYGKPDQSKGQHLTDEFKNPSHLTFSTDSKYSKPGQEGGVWKSEGKDHWSFAPSEFNLKNHRIQEYMDAWDKTDYAEERDKNGKPTGRKSDLIMTGQGVHAGKSFKYIGNGKWERLKTAAPKQISEITDEHRTQFASLQYGVA